jgi:hypothetical protein
MGSTFASRLHHRANSGKVGVTLGDALARLAEFGLEAGTISVPG